MAEKTASLTVLGGPFAGTRCVLPESGTVTVGSALDSTLQLDLPTVSPFHARIEVESGRVTVHDTGADRALHVNDNPLEPGGTVLRNGDILWLGTPGEDDVVMLQCCCRGAPSVDAVPVEPDASPSAAATPTPEVETMALWTVGPGAASPSVPRVAAEPVQEQATGFEETMAIARARHAAEDEDRSSRRASRPWEEMLAAEVVVSPGVHRRGGPPRAPTASPEEGGARGRRPSPA
jgi:hypothetical protein